MKGIEEQMVYTKRQIREMIELVEDNDNSNAYVEPSSSSNGASSLASDLAKTKSENPTDDEFIVNGNDYDGKSANDTMTLDINAKNTQDAARQVQQTMQKPGYKQMANGNHTQFHIHTESTRRRKALKESSILFTKRELGKLLQ